MATKMSLIIAYLAGLVTFPIVILISAALCAADFRASISEEKAMQWQREQESRD
jgi:hypothetical protein